VDNIFSCEGGFFSTGQIIVRETPGVGRYIALTILSSLVFVLIIDSYWPMLFKIYEAIERVYSELKVAILKREEDIKKQALKEKLDKITGIMNGEVRVIPSMEEEERKSKLVEKDITEEKHLFLKIWVVACIIASFIATVVLATVITTCIQNLMAFEKDYCYKLQKVSYDDISLSNSSLRRLSNAESNCSLIELGLVGYISCMNQKKNSLETIQTTTKMQIINIMKNNETGEVYTTISLPYNSEIIDELRNT
jgi:hypothetical protein